MYDEVFKKNQACLNMILEVSYLLRKQKFFEGNIITSKLINNLAGISDYVINRYQEGSQEWLLILQSVLKTQEIRDYILLADILEDDLEPFLRKLQLHLQMNEEIVVSEYWEENIQYIKQRNTLLYNNIIRDSNNEALTSSKVQYHPLLAANGQPTLKVSIYENEFCMHSTINPEVEGNILAESWSELGKYRYQIFGIGMGYHIKALLDIDERNVVSVLENRIETLTMALTYLDWSPYFKAGRLEIIYDSNLQSLMKMINREDDENIFLLHYPSLQCVEQKEIKEALEDYFIFVSSVQEQGRFLRDNFEYLQKQKLQECGKLQKIFKDKRVVIVAGGPSCDDEMENLKKYRTDMSILSVGTVAKKLIDNGIYPDAIIITDPQDITCRQVKGIETDKIPLMLLSTAAKSVVSYYKGPVYLIYQKGYGDAEKVAEEHGYRLFQTGGSVTTTALDVSIGLGAKEIILVGADMAYTDNRSHADGIGREIVDVSGLRRIQSINGEMLYTAKNLDIYRKWIERRIADARHLVVYNTGRGARIAGTVEMSLDKIME